MNNIPVFIPIILHLLLSLAFTASGIQFNGSIYSDLGMMQQYHKHDADTFSFAGFSRLSLRMQSGITESGKVEGSIDIMPLYGVYAKKVSESSSLATVIKSEDVPVVVQLRTLYLSMYLPVVDILIGRQIINFGTATILSPLDVFSSININDITLRRSGTDLISAKFPLGTLSGIDIHAQIPVRDNNTTFAVKGFTNVYDFDLSIVAMYKNKPDEIVGGIGFKGDLFTGIYGEICGHFFPEKSDRKSSINISAGLDYSVKKTIFLTIEYLYNSPAYSHIASPEIQFVSTNTPFFRKHYLYSSIRYAINDLNSFGVYALSNIQDNAATGALFYTCNILQNTDFSVYFQGFKGDFYGTGANAGRMMMFHYGITIDMKF